MDHGCDDWAYKCSTYKSFVNVEEVKSIIRNVDIASEKNCKKLSVRKKRKLN